MPSDYKQKYSFQEFQYKSSKRSYWLKFHLIFRQVPTDLTYLRMATNISDYTLSPPSEPSLKKRSFYTFILLERYHSPAFRVADINQYM